MDSPFKLDVEALLMVLEALPDFVAVLDRDGVLLYLNRVEEGYRMEDVIGTPTRDLLDPDSREAFDAALKATFETGSTPEYPTAVTTPAGAHELYRSRMFPLKRDGRIAAVILVGTNRTDLTAMEREILRLQRLIPICAWCHRIHRVDGAWEPIEAHLNRESQSGVTHAICPDCEQGNQDGFGLGAW